MKQKYIVLLYNVVGNVSACIYIICTLLQDISVRMYFLCEIE